MPLPLSWHGIHAPDFAPHEDDSVDSNLTIAGNTSQARACAGILGNIGLPSFVAAGAADLIEKARYWAEHLPELAELRAGLRGRLQASPGGQPDLIAAHLEAAVRHMWTLWCAGSPAESFSTDALRAMRI